MDIFICYKSSCCVDTFPNVSITGARSTDTSITVNIGNIPSSISRVIIGYHRLDLGVPVVEGYVNNGKNRSRTFSSLVPGAKYRITAWGLGGADNRKRSQSPAVIEVTTMEKSEFYCHRTHSKMNVGKHYNIEYIVHRSISPENPHY